jgi:hypothetical protein
MCPFTYSYHQFTYSYHQFTKEALMQLAEEMQFKFECKHSK